MNAELTRVYVGLGSNLDDPVQQVRKAVRLLDELARARLVEVSSLYRSAPMGPQEQPDYVNAVAALDTSMAPEELLVLLQGIEQFHRRQRTDTHWGPRTLDLDILLYGDHIIQDEHLQIPHAGLPQRNFVLYPLAEIAPNLEVPGIGTLQELLSNCPQGELERMDEVL